jgi:transcriptional regulator with XRE-family HTH domain
VNLGEEFRKHRLRMGVSQEAFALLIGTTQGAVSNWEAGRSELKLSTALRYGERVGLRVLVSVVDVCGDGDGDMWRVVPPPGEWNDEEGSP